MKPTSIYPGGPERSSGDSLTDGAEAGRPMPAKLYEGAHSPDGEMCVMEAVAWVAGEPWTDTPSCACPIITAYCQYLNDRMGDEFRQRLLPYVPRLIGTRSTPEVEMRRAFRAADWAVRRFASAALLSAGLESQARILQELTPIVDEQTARDAAGDAGAAGDAAGDAAWDLAMLCLDDLLSIGEAS